jgi:hypothetical protein
MLLRQQEIQLSAYSDLYDLIVPKENLLRKINELIDFTFIHDELVSKYCSNNGRNTESPIRMFKYLLLKTIYTISDVDVVERSRCDILLKISCLWLQVLVYGPGGLTLSLEYIAKINGRLP